MSVSSHLPRARLILGLGVLLLGMCTISAVTGAAVKPTRDPTIASNTRFVSLSPSKAARGSQIDLLSEIVNGLSDVKLVEVTVGEPPEPYDDEPGTTWLFYKVRSGDITEFVRGYWQANLVSGLFRDQSLAQGQPLLYGHSITRVLADGSEEYDSSSILDRPLIREIDQADERELSDLVRSKLDKNLSLKSIASSRPLGRLAPELHISTKDPSRFLKAWGRNIWNIVGPANGNGQQRARSEGALLDVRDDQGRLVSMHVYSVRTTSGLAVVGPAYLSEASSGTEWMGRPLRAGRP